MLDDVECQGEQSAIKIVFGIQPIIRFDKKIPEEDQRYRLFDILKKREEDLLDFEGNAITC